MARSRGKRSRIRYNLQKLINHIRNSDESWEIINSWGLVEGDDRSQAIVASALLEQALEYAISSNFVLSAKDTHVLFADQEDGGISTFASKIKLAFALGLIEETIQQELAIIKTIRNVFAHTRATVTFETPDIVEACNDLKLPEIVSYGGLMGPKPTTAKGRFSDSIKFIYLYFAAVETYEGIKNPLTYESNDYYCNVFLQRQSTLQLAKSLMALSDASFQTFPGK